MKLIIEIPDDVYNDIANCREDYFPNTLIWAVRNGTPIATESERQKRALAIVDALTEKHLINVMECGCLRRSIILEPERPQGESISLEDGLKKARRGNYVIYDVDFLLDNLAREVNIMESTRQWKAGKGNDND